MVKVDVRDMAGRAIAPYALPPWISHSKLLKLIKVRLLKDHTEQEAMKKNLNCLAI